MSAQAQPIVPPRLRALSAGDLLDESIRLYRRSWMRFLTIAAVTTVPLAVIELALTLLKTSAVSSLSDDLGLPIVVQSGQFCSP